LKILKKATNWPLALSEYERSQMAPCHTEGVFTLARPQAAAIEHQVAPAPDLPLTAPPVLSVSHRLDPNPSLPFGFAYDFRRSRIGNGLEAFEAAKLAFQRWAPFDLGWARVANPDARIVAGQ
jgi:hypothetical protein